MANALPPPKGSAFAFCMALVSQADTDIFKTSVTIGTADVLVSKDGGTAVPIAAAPTELGTSGILNVSLGTAEMNADRVTVLFHDAAGSEWQDALVNIYTAAQTFDTIDTNVDSILADTGTDGVVLANDAITAAKFDESTAFPLASADSGATQVARVGADGDTLETLSDQLDATATAAALATVDGIVDDILVDTAEIGVAGAGLTEAGGTGDHLASIPWNAAWDAEVESEATDALNAYDPPTNAEMEARTLPAANYFDPAADTVATVTSVTNQVTADVTAISGDTTAADNLEAACDGTTYNIGGGAVVAASVTGAVGSVTGAVGSVTGNVGGNVTGSVGSVAAGGITAASIATDAVDADALAADAIAEINATVDTAISDAALATAAALATVDTNVDAILEDTGTTLPASISGLNNLSAAQVNAEVVDVLRTDTIPDSYAADGSQPTIAQAVLAILQFLTEKAVSGTTVTVKKPDGSTSAMTFTLDDATDPTSITRSG